MIYICISIFFLTVLVLDCFLVYQKSCAIHNVRRLCMEEKVQMLSKLIEPMGFAYDPKQDIFLSRTDAWQRDYGYSSLFDRTAPFFQMVFDCEPIYFDYEGKTWMIELWKGQYGINTGCELGIYRADALLSSSERKRFHFHAITDEEMLPVHIDFHKKGRLLFTLSERHWWLAGFCMGLFSQPRQLQMRISIEFPNLRMACAFTDALLENSHRPDTVYADGRIITFCFDIPTTAQPQQRFRIRCALSQWKNRLLCRIYRWITRPFHKNIDRLLYLYHYLPFAFRKLLP